MKHKIAALVFSILISILSLSLSNVSAGTMQEKIDERIRPVGSLCMVGESCAAAQSVARPSLSEKRTGEEIYSSNCVACHASGAAGAPIVGASAASVNAWTPRISKGMETLFTNSIGGINAMPAMGLCMDCSDDEIKLAVCHMVDVVFPVDKITEEVKAACAAVEDD